MRAHYEENCLMCIKIKRQTYFTLDRRRYFNIQILRQNEKRLLKVATMGKDVLPEGLAPQKFCLLGHGQGVPEKTQPTPNVEVWVRKEKKP